MIFACTNLFIIFSVTFFSLPSTQAEPLYYAPSNSVDQDESLLVRRQLDDCYSRCPVGTTEIEGEWRYGSCCGEAEDCCEANPGLYILVMAIILVVVICSCAYCPCCPMYDCLCCSPNGPCGANQVGPQSPIDHRYTFPNPRAMTTTTTSYSHSTIRPTHIVKPSRTMTIWQDLEAPTSSTKVHSLQEEETEGTRLEL